MSRNDDIFPVISMSGRHQDTLVFTLQEICDQMHPRPPQQEVVWLTSRTHPHKLKNVSARKCEKFLWLQLMDVHRQQGNEKKKSHFWQQSEFKLSQKYIPVLCTWTGQHTANKLKELRLGLGLCELLPVPQLYSSSKITLIYYWEIEKCKNGQKYY